MRIIKEPLFHFLLLGLGIFLWFNHLNPQSSEIPESSEIIVTDQQVDRMLQQFQSVWNRPPSQTEFKGLIDAMLREEVLVREAQSLGLEQNDSIVRKRLVQKMEFLTVSAAQSATPGENDLMDFYKDNPDLYQRQAAISFEQVFLGSTIGESEVSAAITNLNTGANPASIGQASLLPPEMPLSSRQSVDGTFGPGVFEAVSQLEPGVWGGPIQSAYGTHALKVVTMQPVATRPFEEVRDKVTADWRQDMSATLVEAQYNAVKSRYQIQMPDLTAFEGRFLK